MSDKQLRSGSHLRSRLPQELWDKVSEDFGHPRDWHRMNAVMAHPHRDVNGKTKKMYHGFDTKLDIDYPYGPFTPAYDKRINAITHVQQRFKRNRVPYDSVIKENKWNWDQERTFSQEVHNETRSFFDKVKDLSLQMLKKGNIASFDTLVKTVNCDIGCELDDIDDDLYEAFYFFIEWIGDQLKKGISVDWYIVYRNLKYYSETQSYVHYFEELLGEVIVEFLYRPPIISKNRLLKLFKIILDGAKKQKMRIIYDADVFGDLLTRQEQVAVGFYIH